MAVNLEGESMEEKRAVRPAGLEGVSVEDLRSRGYDLAYVLRSGKLVKEWLKVRNVIPTPPVAAETPLVTPDESLGTAEVVPGVLEVLEVPGTDPAVPDPTPLPKPVRRRRK